MLAFKELFFPSVAATQSIWLHIKVSSYYQQTLRDIHETTLLIYDAKHLEGMNVTQT